MKRRIFGLIIVVICCYQCQAPETAPNVGMDSFYDLKAFLSSEKERLTTANARFQKTVILNGVEETKLIDQPNYAIEFSEFESSDINRVSWYDKYDEQKSGDEIHYTATDEKLEVRKLSVLKKGEEVEYIQIEKGRKNLLNTAAKELEYKPAEGYHIKSVRKSIGESADTLEIKVKFIF